MAELIASYRLQFRQGMTFEKAAALVPYLSRLGVSHLYASPIFAATPGSTHGYDIIDYNQIEPELGGGEGLAELSAALSRRGMELIIDFVPNHMSASPENPWWRDVLEWGQQSQRAAFFDIDWTAPKLLIPVLPEPYGDALAHDTFRLDFNPRLGTLSFKAGPRYPLTPPSYAGILGHAGDGFADLATRFAMATPDTAPELKSELAARVEDPKLLEAIRSALRRTESDHEAMHALHEAQVWRLAYWRTARETLTYRRFFEVADLVGVRMEQPTVFEESHRLVLKLIADGIVWGLRLDHVDGLADPKAYFQKLQQATGRIEPLPLLVEKILASAEELRPEWPVLGTTGYEFCRIMGGVLTDPSGEAALTESYAAFIGETPSYPDLLRNTKRHILVRNLAGELDTLSGLALSIAESDLATRDFGRDTLRRALIELAVGLPVYRTYVDAEGAKDADRALIDIAVAAAKDARELEDEAAIDFIARVWRLEIQDPTHRASALLFTTRFQQTTGPLMAKAVEDTLFYRFNRLIALNEVGGSPDAFGCDVSSFHAWMQAREERQPFGLLASTTHDTKRGEDARARLYILSEAPDAFASSADRWRKLNARFRTPCKNGSAPSANDEWMFYQSLLGAWPNATGLDDAEALARLAARMQALMLKAAREAKLHTSWTAPDEEYEQGLTRFVAGVLHSANRDFLSEFLQAKADIDLAGALNGLSQTLIKLTGPGVPDIYQGAELWDFSLVDPDNRAAVDFERREQLLDEETALSTKAVLDRWKTGLPKLRLIRRVLAARRRFPELFTLGEYRPAAVSGADSDHVIAFFRRREDGAALVVAPIRAKSLLRGSTLPLVPPEVFGDTQIELPPELQSSRWTEILTGEDYAGAESLRLSELLREFPVALLLKHSQ